MAVHIKQLQGAAEIIQQVDFVKDNLNGKVKLQDNSLVVSVPVKVPTPELSSSNTNVATTAFVNNVVQQFSDTIIEELNDTLNISPDGPSGTVTFATVISDQLNGKQDKHAALTSISNLTTSADQMLYTTNTNTYSTTPITQLGREILAGTSAAEIRSIIGAISASNTTTGLASPVDITISDSSGTNTGTAVSFDGSTDITLKLPSTITGSLSGNATTATKAVQDGNGLTISSTYAKINSPALSGIPTAPTASVGTNTTQIATTAFVNGTISTLADQLDAKQDKSAALTSIAGLTTAADEMIYTTASNTYATTPISAFARTVLDDVNAATLRNTIDVYSKTEVQNKVSALVNSAPETLDTLNELATALGNDPNFATTMATALGSKQPLHAALTSIAGLTTAANNMIYTTAKDIYAVATLTPKARELLDDTDVATMRNTLAVPSKTGEGASGTWGISISGTAANATNDKNGSDITTTYETKANAVTGMSASGTTVTYTKGDGTEGSFITQDTDTHYTTHLYAGKSDGVTNAATTNGATHLILTDNTTARNRIKISGSGATTVTSDANGNITISSTDTNTNTDTLVTQNVSTANDTYPVLLVATANATASQGAKTAIFGSGVKVNPSTSTVTATTFSGNLAGKASTAAKIDQAVNINISDNSSANTGTAVSFDGSAGITLKLPATIEAALSGNATSATNATNDANGHDITETYATKTGAVHSITASGTTVTYKDANGKSLGNFITQDTDTHYTTHLYAGASDGIANAATSNGATHLILTDDTTARNRIKISGSGATTVTSDANGNITISSTDTNTNTDTLVTQNKSTANATYPILATPTADANANQGAKTSIFASGIKINPSTSSVIATNFTGLASKATADANGNTITTTYATKEQAVTGFEVDGTKVTFTRADGTKGTFTTQDTNTDTNTHYTTHLYAGTSSGNANAQTSNGNTYLILADDSTVRHRVKLVGSGGTTVTSDTSGNITISSTGGTSTDTLMTQTLSTTNNTYPILATATANATATATTTAVFASGVKLNPSTGTISATAFTGNLTGNVTGNVSGTAANVTGIVAVANGGTGKTSLADVTVGAATKATQDGSGKVITETYATKAQAVTDFSVDGTKVTFTRADGSQGNFITQDTNTDTHWYTYLYAGTSSGNANATTTNGNTYLIVTDNTTARNRVKISGSGATTVTSDANGNITISSTDTNTNTDTLMTQNVSTANATYPILLVAAANATANQGAKTAIFASGVKVNPSTSTISATAFVGNVTGNVSGSSGSCTGNATTATTATKATQLTTARTIDGVDFDGTAAISHYGTCSTAAATAAKTVALAKFVLVTGALITVKFTVTNTAANPTLNVNSTGAKAIYYRGAAVPAAALQANSTYVLVYDGTNYDITGSLVWGS